MIGANFVGWLHGKYERYAAFVIAAYCAVWIGCLLTLPGFYLDTYDMFAFGQGWQLGYWKHPPLPAWLAEIGFVATGGWPQSQSVLAVGAAGLTLVYLFRLTRDIRGAQWALVAVALSMVNYYLTRPIETLNHNIVQLPLWVMTVFYFRRAFLTNSRIAWVLLGAVAALLIYAKYSGGILLVLLALFALVQPDYRRRLASPGPYIAAAVFLLLLSPHLYWLVANDFLPFRYPFESTPRFNNLADRAMSPVMFLLAQVAFHLPMLIVLAIGLLGWRKGAGKLTLAGEETGRSDFWLVMLSGVAPIILVGLSSLWSGTSVRTEVGGSLVALSGLVLVLLFPATLMVRRPVLAGVVWAVLMVGAPIGWVVSLHLGASEGRVAPELIPDRALSAAMAANWKSRMTTPLTIVAGSSIDAGPVTLYAKPRPLVLIDFDMRHSSWITPAQLDRDGALAVWRKWSNELVAPDGLVALAGDRQLEIGGEVALPIKENVSVRYGWAIIYPK